MGVSSLTKNPLVTTVLVIAVLLILAGLGFMAVGIWVLLARG